MTDIQKFLSDARRIIKHDRADNGGRYDSLRACNKIIDLFESNNRSLGELPRSIGEYWLTTYINTSDTIQNEPSDENLDRIGSMQSFLDGEKTGFDSLSQDDWIQMRQLVDYEAEDLPLDILESMMSVILEKGALE